MTLYSGCWHYFRDVLTNIISCRPYATDWEQSQRPETEAKPLACIGVSNTIYMQYLSLRCSPSREFSRWGELKNGLTAPLKMPQRPCLVYKLSTLKTIRTEQIALIYKSERPFLRLSQSPLFFFLMPCDLASVARARERVEWRRVWRVCRDTIRIHFCRGFNN